MTKSQIIDAVVGAVRAREGDIEATGYDIERLIADLNGRLDHIEPGADVRTCEDFDELGIECCSVCHSDYPDFELSLTDIEAGGFAWLCCALDTALNRYKHAAMEQSPEWIDIQRLLSDQS